jgi:hypothetical protein
MMILKCCTCGKEKDESYFARNKSKPVGWNTMCKPCNKEYKKEYYKKNKAEILKKCRQYEINNWNKVLARGRAWRAKNRDKENLRGKVYRGKNKEKESARRKRYVQNNREKVNESANRYSERNRERCNKVARKSYWKNIDNYIEKRTVLHESYLKGLINTQLGLKVDEIPDGMIELKGFQIGLYRAIREAKSNQKHLTERGRDEFCNDRN